MPHAPMKLQRLQQNLKKMNKVAIAFSGGVDSTFLTKIAYDILDDNALALTASSSIHPQWEIKQTKTLATKIGIRQLIIDTNELDIEHFSENRKDRCYYCKKDLFSKIKQIAAHHDIIHVLDGSTIDDILDYRPGLKALRELEIISPLRDVGFTKQEIRDLSKKIGLETWDKPSFACLASRFPYGITINKKRLNDVEKAEDIIRCLGIKQFRVRFHYDIARIEVEKNAFTCILEHSETIIKQFKELGFTYITLDIEGFRNGSLNEMSHISHIKG